MWSRDVLRSRHETRWLAPQIRIYTASQEALELTKEKQRRETTKCQQRN